MSFSTLPVAVWTLAVLAIVMFMRVAYELMIPIVLGLLISFALNPIVVWLERVRVPRIAGAAIVLIALTGALGFGIYSLRDEASEVLEGVPRAARQLRQSMQASGSESLLAQLRRAMTEVQKTAEASGAQPPRVDPEIPAASGGTVGGSMLARGSANVIALAGNIVVVFFLVFFLLIGGRRLKDRLIAVAGPQRRITGEILDDINWQVQRFLLVRLITSIIVAVATTIVLLLMGITQATFWGVAAGIFNSIPYFGPIIVSGGLLIVGLMQFGDVWKGIQIGGAAMVITTLEGWLLEPPMMGRAARMNAITVFIGPLVWSWIWGIWGTILAVPMLATFKAVCDHIDPLKRIGKLMGE